MKPIESSDLWAERRLTFRRLHEQAGVFVIPNPWDVGSAKILAAAGFGALASTSAGYAFARGKRDNHVPREEMFTHIGELVAATPLPVNADLENGYGDDPTQVAETISMALAAGLAGASIEDARGKPDSTIYPIELAVERITAAVEAAQSPRTHFVLTARAENFLCGNPDLNDTIKRLQAYQKAGADVLYAPGLTTEEQIRAVVSSVDKPVNVVAGLASMPYNVDELAAMKVKRISLGSTLARVAFGALQQAAAEMLQQHSFGFFQHAIPFAEIDAMMAEQK